MRSLADDRLAASLAERQICLQCSDLMQSTGAQLMTRRFDEAPTEETRAVQVWHILVAHPTTRRTPTYGSLAEHLGYDGAGVFARILGHIMYYCRANDLPPLTVLVVKKATGFPAKDSRMQI